MNNGDRLDDISDCCVVINRISSFVITLNITTRKALLPSDVDLNLQHVKIKSFPQVNVNKFYKVRRKKVIVMNKKWNHR